MAALIRSVLVIELCVFLVLGGCLPSGTEVEPAASSGLPTPTIHPFFLLESSTPVRIQPTLTKNVSVDSSPTSEVTPNPLLDLSQSEVKNVVVYDDELSSDWLALEGENIEANLADTAVVHNGRYSISITPSEDFSTQYFVVNKNADQQYLQDRIIAIYFWINGGESFLELEDLAFTIVGSDELPYYMADDTSAYIDDQFPFSETRLYHLGLNQTIPPNTWVEVEVLLDNLIYDPDYTYVTGFYIKNNEGYTHTFYVDDISVLMVTDEDSGQASPSEDEAEGATSLESTLTPTVALSSTSEISTTSTIPPTPTLSDSSVECVVTPPPGWDTYRIVAGDAISTLAIQSGIAPEELMQANCILPGEPLSVGQEIYRPPLQESATPMP
ncbi:MAG: LysM peptidoglycan-binding domain-containing protein [Anaerolineaceae bacterium]|nr:LysM peptidoglycan-binding domain-containing protein [Anaerolineaceae bacterium]